MQQSARRVDAGIQLYLGSGLWIVIVGYLALLEIWGFVTISIYEWGIGEAAKDPSLRAIFVLDFILGFLYIAWYQRNVSGYTASARAFLNLCEYTTLLAKDTLSLVKDMHGMLKYMKRKRENNIETTYAVAPRQRAIPPSALVPISSPYSYVAGSVSDSPNLMLPFTNVSAPPNYTRTIVTAAPKQQDVEKTESTMEDSCILLLCMRDSCIAIIWATFGAYDSSNTSSIQVESPPVTKILRDYSGQPVEMLKRLSTLVLVTIKQLENTGKLGHGDLKLIFDHYTKVEEHTASLIVESSILEPTVFDHHLKLVLGVYFFVWLPYSLWQALGWHLTLVFYPIVTYLLTGFSLVRFWIGESFDSGSRYHYMNHLYQRDTYLQRIRQSYNVDDCDFLTHITGTTRSEEH